MLIKQKQLIMLVFNKSHTIKINYLLLYKLVIKCDKKVILCSLIQGGGNYCLMYILLEVNYYELYYSFQ
jgi:hypothetical protein